jgi:hypothetical protein
MPFGLRGASPVSSATVLNLAPPDIWKTSPALPTLCSVGGCQGARVSGAVLLTFFSGMG